MWQHYDCLLFQKILTMPEMLNGLDYYWHDIIERVISMAGHIIKLIFMSSSNNMTDTMIEVNMKIP